MYTLFRGVWGHAPPEKFWNFKPSESDLRPSTDGKSPLSQSSVWNPDVCLYNSTSGWGIVSLALHCTHEVEAVTSVVVPMQADISFVWLLRTCTIRDSLYEPDTKAKHEVSFWKWVCPTSSPGRSVHVVSLAYSDSFENSVMHMS